MSFDKPKRVGTPRTSQEPGYLFVLNPAYCGSTVFAQFLLTSPKAAAIWSNAEGQRLPQVRLMMEPRRWNPERQLPWGRIKRAWLDEWDRKRAERPDICVLIEKSPPDMLRAAMIARVFTGAKFIVWMREPFAWCASFRGRKVYRGRTPGSYTDAARTWLMRARQQRWNSQNLPGSLALTYEEFVADPTAAKAKVAALCPALDDIDVDLQADVKDYSPGGIVDHNPRQRNLLSAAERAEIATVLAEDPSVMSFFGYRLDDV